MTAELHLNPIKCTGHGLCAELLPELIELDEWGYPVVARLGVGPDLMKDARRAVSACPTLALRLQQPAMIAPANRS
jgi:ferredoxin